MRALLAPIFAGSTLVLAAAPATVGAFDLQGHRGARGLAPENTLAAFEEALRVGVTTLELDLGMSRDGELVVSHDPRLDPDLTRGPDGAWIDPPGPRLLDLDLQEIQRFDVGRSRPGSEVAERFPEQRPADGARVPTLAEVVELTRGLGADAVRFNIETKLSPLQPDLAPPPEEFARRLAQEIRTLGIAGRAAVQSFDWRTLRAVQDIAPEIPTVCLTAERRWLDTLRRWRPGASPWLAGLDADDFASVPELVDAAGCQVWSPYHGDLDAADLERARALGLEIVVWTVNDRETMAELIRMGVDGIITDYPDRLRDVLAAHGRELPAPVGG